MRDEGILCMRSDSFEWICNKLRIRTYQGLTETFGFAAGRRVEKKKKIRVNGKRKMTVGNSKSVQGTSSLRLD